MSHNSKKILKIIKARLHIAPYMPKPKCVSGTIGMKWNCASGKRLPLLFRNPRFTAVALPQLLRDRFFTATAQRQLISTHKVFIHTNRRSMISGILSARHTGSLAFRLQKIFSRHTAEINLRNDRSQRANN